MLTAAEPNVVERLEGDYSAGIACKVSQSRWIEIRRVTPGRAGTIDEYAPRNVFAAVGKDDFELEPFRDKSRSVGIGRRRSERIGSLLDGIGRRGPRGRRTGAKIDRLALKCSSIDVEDGLLYVFIPEDVLQSCALAVERVGLLVRQEHLTVDQSIGGQSRLEHNLLCQRAGGKRFGRDANGHLLH